MKKSVGVKVISVLGLITLLLVTWTALVAAQTVTITWACDSKSGPPGYEMREEIKNIFEERNPGIKVKIQQCLGEWADKITTQMVAGNAPDLIDVWGAPLLKWMDAGQFVNLDPYFDEEFLEDFSPAQVKRGRGRDGHLYLMGTFTGPNFSLYYNKDIFDDAGVSYPDGTWDQNMLLESAKKLTNKEAKIFGYQVAGRLEWNLRYFIWTNGGRIVPEEEGRATKVLLDQPKALEAMEFVHDMVFKHHVSPLPGEMGDLKAWNTFLFGMVAMQVNGFSDLQFNWDGAKFRWDIAQLPKGPAGRANPQATEDAIAAYSGTEHLEEAMRFMRFRVSPELARNFYIPRESQMPSRLSVLPEWAKLSALRDNLSLENLVADMPYMRPMLVTIDDAKMFELLNPMLDKIFRLNKVPVREGITEISEKINTVFAELAKAG